MENPPNRKLSLGEDEAQPEVVVRVAGRVVEPVRGAAEPGRVAPAATAAHAERPTACAGGIGLGVAVVTAVPVLTPFPNVACHVIDAEFVGLFCFHGMRLVVAIAFIPCHVVNAAAAAVLRVAALVAAAGSKFPFRFGGETETFAREGVQLADEGLAIVPRHRLHGQVVAFEVGRIAAHHCLPQCLRHLRLTDVVTAQRDLVGGFLVIPRFCHFRGGAHGESTAGDIFHAIGDVAHAKHLVLIGGGDAGGRLWRWFWRWLWRWLWCRFRMLAFVGAL